MEMFTSSRVSWEPTPFYTNTGEHPPAESCCPKFQSLLRKQQELLRIFSLKFYKNLIKKIIKLQNQYPSLVKRVNRESFTFKTAVKGKDVSVSTMLNFTNCNREEPILSPHGTYWKGYYWLFTQGIRHLEVCSKAGGKMKTKQLPNKTDGPKIHTPWPFIIHPDH